ncbi:ComEC/Rec2 family competence protein [Patescibacteria group bacterium]|nr:ComEC/Rec2 family competence protein [Patescibacteria group bacterium]MCL5091564.1 ComEC/Rec2 family competence protein [Patescibacteria group bacterium]
MIGPEIFTSVIDSYLPEPQAALLNGIIFGVKLKTTTAFYQQIKTVGLLHIVVLSGANITILTAIVLRLTQFLSKSISIVISILITIFFIVFVGPQAPVIRAAVMNILTLVAILLGRKNYALYSLLLSLIFIAIFYPDWLTTLSLQLSYGATLGLILFSRFRFRSRHPWLNYLGDELTTSLAAQFFTVPLIFAYFRTVSLISPLANVCVSFTIAPVMILGLVTALAGLVWHPLGQLSAYLCYGILVYITTVIKWLSQVPGGYWTF